MVGLIKVLDNIAGRPNQVHSQCYKPAKRPSSMTSYFNSIWDPLNDLWDDIRTGTFVIEIWCKIPCSRNLFTLQALFHHYPGSSTLFSIFILMNDNSIRTKSKNPRREGYPADVFNVHASLLERSGKTRWNLLQTAKSENQIIQISETWIRFGNIL